MAAQSRHSFKKREKYKSLKEREPEKSHSTKVVDLVEEVQEKLVWFGKVTVWARNPGPKTAFFA